MKDEYKFQLRVLNYIVCIAGIYLYTAIISDGFKMIDHFSKNELGIIIISVFSTLLFLFICNIINMIKNDVKFLARREKALRSARNDERTAGND